MVAGRGKDIVRRGILASAYARGRLLVPPPARPLLRSLVSSMQEARHRVRYVVGVRRLRRLAPDIYERLTRSGMDPVLQEHFLTHLGGQPAARLKSLSLRSEHLLCTDVLYVSSKLSVDAIKDAIALRRDGGLECTILYSADSGNRDLATKYDIKLLPYEDYWGMVNLLAQFRSPLTIARRGEPAETALVSLFGPGKIVYKPYDFVLRYPREIERPERYFAEEFVLQRADGLIHFHEDGVALYLKERYGYGQPAIQVRPGCMDEFCIRPGDPKLSELDGEIHLVYAAGLARSYSDLRKVGDSDHYDEFVQMLEQGLHLHVYIAYQRPSDRNGGLRHYFDLADRYDNFHIEETLPYSELVRELTRYDYAYDYFAMRSRTMRLDEDVLFRGLSNQFYTYLDAGLPVICSHECLGMAELVQRYQLGVILDAGEIGHLGSILHGLDRDTLVANTASARPHLLYESDKLVSFVRELCGQ